MPIDFICSHCGIRTNVPDEFAGQSGPCAGCGQMIRIPTPAPAGGAVAVPTARSSSTKTVLLIIVGIMLLMILMCGSMITFMAMNSVNMVQNMGYQTDCSNNLKQLGLAMDSYHVAYGCFPPAYLADEDGTPKHSWRVLLLPFLEEQELYEKYDFDEPWDGPNNRRLVKRMPDVFQCPADTKAAATETNYFMIVGEGTLSDGSSVTQRDDVIDGLNETIMFIESTQNSICWMEPRDLDAAQISFDLNPTVSSGEISSEHEMGVNSVFCDGSAHYLGDYCPSEDVRAGSTIAGGEDSNLLYYDMFDESY